MEVKLDIKIRKGIKKCVCGGNDFDVVENIRYRHMEINQDGVLEIGNSWSGEIDTINCSNCGKEYGEMDFKDIQFCG